MRKKKRSCLGSIIRSVISLAIIVAILLGGVIGYLKLPVIDYYNASRKAFEIPEINNGYVPQGLHYDQENGLFIMSGYIKDGSASPIYVVDGDGEMITKVTLKNPDGTVYCGHGGGVAVGEQFMYVTGGEKGSINVYDYDAVLNAERGAIIDCLGEFSLNKGDEDYVGTSFVTVVGDRLITGEFYRDESYPTAENHKFTTLAGDYNQALAIEFSLDGSSEFGINPKPVKAYSMPDQVQGLTIHDGKIYLSTSWGLSFSHIHEYREDALQYQTNITLLGHDLELYAMDSASKSNDYKIAPMSEEIAFVGGELYVHCESASDKYIFGKLTGANYIYKTDLSKMK